MAVITKIKPSQAGIKPKLRVAAYARVSMETEMLHHSLSAQVSYYSSLIQKNPEWAYAGVYADEGITGTSIVHRDEFNRLVSDCESGKIDMVLVKSISRFARDTVDCLNTTRHLKNMGIAVYFERENINSLSNDGELLLTLLASFAQEESRSISENVKWATRKRFKQGIPNGHKAPFGYEWDGEMFRVIPEQGKVVKEIFRRYLAGESAYIIAKDMGKQGITGQQGRPLEQTTVKDIISSLSYTGTMILQKNYFTEGHVRRKNNGELPKYLVEEMFEPLISEDEFRLAQEIRQRRADEMPNRNVNRTIFSGMVKCGNCGRGISRRTTGNKKRWICNTRERKGMSACDCRPLDESELVDATAKVLGGTGIDDEQFYKKIQQIIIYGDRIEFHMGNGYKREILREYSGCRGQNAFTNKCKCGICGGKCERDNFGKKGKKVWCCSKPRSVCQLKRLDEHDLIKAAVSVLGERFEGKVVEKIKDIIINDDSVEFHFKEGTVKTWQRK